MTPVEALGLWDDHQSQKYPAGQATFDVNGYWLVEITDAAEGHLSTVSDSATGVACPIWLGVAAAQS